MFFKDFTNHRKKTNRAVVFSSNLSQHSNFSSKAVGKIIAEVEAKKSLFASAVPQHFFFADVIKQSLYLPWQFPGQSSKVTTAMLFYLINDYKTIINCSLKPVNNSK